MRIHKKDVWKVISLIGGMAVFMASGHLPPALEAHKEVIETIAFLWSTAHAVLMMPPYRVKKDHDTISPRTEWPL